jgi:predicted nucleic acid-binding protein
MRCVDANVFIYILVKSPQKDYEISRNILKRIEKRRRNCHKPSRHPISHRQARIQQPKKEVRSFLTAVNSYLTLNKLSITWDSLLTTLDDMERQNIEFVDALNLQTMKKNKINEIYSNDKDFDRVQWTKRIWE